MTHEKVLQLIRKYADDPAQTKMLNDSNVKFHHQRKRLSDFFRSLELKLRVLRGEMESDLHLLKEKGFDRKMWNMLAQLWQDIVDITKGLDESRPYETAYKLIDYVNSRTTRSIIDNLDFLAQHHLEKTKEDFIAGPVLQHPQVRSLRLLTALSEHLQQYLAENPLLPVPGKTVPGSLPPLQVQPEEFGITPIGPSTPTVPAIPIKRQVG